MPDNSQVFSAMPFASPITVFIEGNIQCQARGLNGQHAAIIPRRQQQAQPDAETGSDRGCD
jgi:hypothetical protein